MRELPAARQARAVAAACAVAAAHGLRVDEPVVLADLYAVRVHLAPAPVVARVSTATAILRDPIAPWLARELDVAAFLAAAGAPVVPPSDLLPPGPHLHDGLGISFWRHAAPIDDTPPDAARVGAMLADLHAALRAYPGDLPLLAPPLGDILRALDRLDRRPGGSLAAADLAIAHRVWDRLRPDLTPGGLGPLQPIHGDAHAGNLIHTAAGWLWNDFEDTSLGPVAWDLANFEDGSPAHAGYGRPVDAGLLDLARRVRLLHGVVWVHALLDVVEPSWMAYVPALVEQLRAFDT